MKKALVSPPGLRWTLGTSKDESESYFVKIIKIFNRILRDILMQSIIGVILARFLALVTTMVTKVDHGNYGWLPRLVTMVSYLGYQGANYGY